MTIKPLLPGSSTSQTAPASEARGPTESRGPDRSAIGAPVPMDQFRSGPGSTVTASAPGGTRPALQSPGPGAYHSVGRVEGLSARDLIRLSAMRDTVDTHAERIQLAAAGGNSHAQRLIAFMDRIATA